MKREIKTTLVLDGEQKFKQELQAAAREMRVLKSETRANTVAFGDQAQSVEALTQRNQGLTKQAEQQRETVAALSRAVDESAAKYGEADRRTDGYRIRLNNARTALSQIENEIHRNNKAIAEQTDWWRKAGESAEKAGKKITAAGKGITKVGNTLTKGVTLPLVAAGAAALKASIDFETAFAGVQKTVDGTDAQIAALKQGIIDMSLELPASTTEIAAVAEAAGQLGIETDNVLKFSRTMIDLGQTTNIVSEDAAKLLAQFANVTQMAQSDFDRLGSVIVALGNNFATTEADIVAMGHRLGGAGKQIGLTEAQIMGLANALASVGIRAEAGGTAFSKIFSEMQVSVETSNKRLQDFARVSGMSATAFQKAFRDDAAGAITSFIEGLSSMSEEGMSSIGVLQEMGITELRLRDSLLRVSNAGDLVRSSLAMANQAWDENTALTKEAALRYGTTASQMKMVRNEAIEVARQFGDAMVPVLRDVLAVTKDLIHGFSQMSDEEKKNIIVKAALVAAIGPAISGIGRFTTMVGGAVTQLGNLSTAIANAGGLGAVISGPAGWAVMGAIALGGLALKIAEVARESRTLTVEANELDAAMDNTRKSFASAQSAFGDTAAKTLAATEVAERYIDRLEELERVGLDTAESQREYAGIVGALKSTIPGLNVVIDQQTGLIVGGTRALRDNTEQWQKNAIAQALQRRQAAEIEAYTDALVEQAKKTAELKDLENELAERRAANARRNAGDNRRFVDVGIKPLEERIAALRESIGASNITVASMAAALDLTEEAAQQLADELGVGLTESLNELTEAEAEAAAQAAEMAAQVDKMADVTQNAFTKIDKKGKISVKEMIKNLEYNQKAVENWANNLAILAERGIEEGLLQQLRDAGPEMRTTVAAMVDASDEELERLNDVFRNGVQTAVDGAKEIGSQTGAGFAEGIEGQTDKVQSAAKALAGAMKGALKVDLEIASPSKVAYRDGQYYVDGLVNALEDGQKRVARAATGLSKSVNLDTGGGGSGATHVSIENHFHGPVSKEAVAQVERATDDGLTAALKKRGYGGSYL